MPEDTADSSRSLVIIDDDPDDLMLLRRAVVKGGFADPIRTFEDAAEAIEYVDAFARRQGDWRMVVICDLRMPGLDGFGFLQRIRARPFSHRLSVIIISGCALESDVECARSLGADGYLEKTPDSDTLRASLEAPVFPAIGSRPQRFESWEATRAQAARRVVTGPFSG